MFVQLLSFLRMSQDAGVGKASTSIVQDFYSIDSLRRLRLLLK